VRRELGDSIQYIFRLRILEETNIVATVSQMEGPNYTKFWEETEPSSALPELF